MNTAILNALYEQLDEVTRRRVDAAADRIIDAKERGKKVVVVTGSGPNVHEGVTTLIAELLRQGIVDGVSTSSAVVAHEMGGTLDKVKRCNGVALGLDSAMLPRGGDFELTLMPPEVAAEVARHMEIDADLVARLEAAEGKTIIKAAGNLGYPMGLWIERLSCEIRDLARDPDCTHKLRLENQELKSEESYRKGPPSKGVPASSRVGDVLQPPSRSRSFEEIAGLGADERTMIGAGAQRGLPIIVTIPQLIGGGLTGLAIGDSLSITDRATRLAQMLDSAEVIIESGVALTQEIHDGPCELYTGHGLWSAWDGGYSYSLEGKSLIRIDLDPALELVHQAERGGSAVQQAIADGLPKTKTFKVPFRMEMSGFARHEGSLPIIGDIGVIWPLIARRVADALEIDLEFISYPQQTEAGRAMREYIVDSIRPISREKLLAALK